MVKLTFDGLDFDKGASWNLDFNVRSDRLQAQFAFEHWIPLHRSHHWPWSQICTVLSSDPGAL